jgi:hypothetical protein
MMQVETFTYNEKTGWSVPTFPQLDSPQTILFIFAACKYKDKSKPIQELQAFYKNSHILGCSTAGEIYQDSVNDDTITVAVGKFEHTTIQTTEVLVSNSQNSYDAGATIAKNLLTDELSHIFVLSDGLAINGTELVKGIIDNVPNTVMIGGGLAGDGSKFQSTWTLFNHSQPTAGVAIAAGLYGDRIRVAYGSQGGWDVFGPERIITKSEKNVLYEIDGQPALALYKKYLGERANELPAAALLFPLAIRGSTDEKNIIVRTILSVNEKDNSMTFAGNMPEGWLAQLMTANFERLIDGAANAGANATLTDVTAPILTLAISCVGRKLVLGERVDEEVDATLERMPPQTKQIGFYSYGEISPLGVSNCELHNQTMTLTSFTEI